MKNCFLRRSSTSIEFGNQYFTGAILKQTNEDNVVYIEKCHNLLMRIYENTARGDQLYSVFIKLIKLFMNVSPELRTELFLQLIIYTNHSTKLINQRGKSKGLAVFCARLELCCGRSKVLFVSAQLHLQCAQRRKGFIRTSAVHWLLLRVADQEQESK